MNCDCESPSCFARTVRRARKPHRCYECGCAIRPKTDYIYISGVWDHRPDNFAICVECDAMRKAFEAHVRDGKETERIANRGVSRASWKYDYLCDCVALGSLAHALSEFCVEVLGYRADGKPMRGAA